jgi:hypothetical protein
MSWAFSTHITKNGWLPPPELEMCALLGAAVLLAPLTAAHVERRMMPVGRSSKGSAKTCHEKLHRIFFVLSVWLR